MDRIKVILDTIWLRLPTPVKLLFIFVYFCILIIAKFIIRGVFVYSVTTALLISLYICQKYIFLRINPDTVTTQEFLKALINCINTIIDNLKIGIFVGVILGLLRQTFEEFLDRQINRVHVRNNPNIR